MLVNFGGADIVFHRGQTRAPWYSQCGAEVLVRLHNHSLFDVPGKIAASHNPPWRVPDLFMISS